MIVISEGGGRKCGEGERGAVLYNQEKQDLVVTMKEENIEQPWVVWIGNQAQTRQVAKTKIELQYLLYP